MARIMTQDSESLEFYFRDITSSEPLSGDEELELSQRIHKGDQKARDKLVLANLRFVVLVAREYQSRGLSMAELISAGNIGLMTAVERFDGTRGFKFISYAVWWIRQAIQKSLLEEPWVVRLPLNRIALLRNIARISQEFQQTRDVEPEILAEKLGVSVEMVRDTLMLAQGVLSLDAPVSEDIDIIITDLKMPGLTGVEFTENVPHKIPVIILSAYLGAPEFQGSLKHLHPAAVFGKPFGLSELRNAIRQALS